MKFQHRLVKSLKRFKANLATCRNQSNELGRKVITAFSVMETWDLCWLRKKDDNQFY